jgi:predicted alpha/beta hydrolase family esterase
MHRAQEKHTLYTFDTWADQLCDFIEEKVGEPAFLVTNSIGGVAALQVRSLSHNNPDEVQYWLLVCASTAPARHV